jgi:hypothetical protein
MPSLLEIIAKNERNRIFQQNIIFADDIEDTIYNFIVQKDDVGQFVPIFNPTDDYLVESRKVVEIGRERYLDLKDLNLHQPEEDYPLIDLIDNNANGIPENETVIVIGNRHYDSIVKYNLYQYYDHEYINIQEPLIITNFKEDYLDYIRPIQTLLDEGGYTIVDIFLGRVNVEDTSLGVIGADALKNALEINFQAGINREIIGQFNTNIYDLVSDGKIYQGDFSISRPRGTIDQVLNFVQKLQGITIPFSYLPQNVFGLEQDDLTPEERNSLLFEYTGRGQKLKTVDGLKSNAYRPEIDSDNKRFAVQGRYYIDITTLSTIEFNAIYQSQAQAANNPSLGELIDENGVPVINSANANVNKNLINDTLEINTEDEDEEPFNWSVNTRNPFSSKSLLYKTKELVIRNDASAFLDNFSPEFRTVDNSGKDQRISKGSTITNKNGEYFRAFHKGFKYNRLNRTLRHRALDNGDRRSTLADNGMPIYAPTKRTVLNGGVSREVILRNYMFSIANSAWKYNSASLPECEKYLAPDGFIYRQLWFAPYDIQFSETVSQNLDETYFIGRPEAIYTYNNTIREASLSFALLIDHPLITRKVKDDVTHILERYFRGDETIEAEINQIIKNNLTPEERDELEKLKRIVTPKEIVIDEEVVSTDAKNDTEAKRSISTFNTKALSVYFPNDVTVLPKSVVAGTPEQNGGYEDGNTTLGFTYLNGVQKTTPQYRDTFNYGLNIDFYEGEGILNLKSELDTIFSNENTTKVKIVFRGHASAAISNLNSNYNLALKRAENVRLWFVDNADIFGFFELASDDVTISYEVISASDEEDLNSTSPTPDDSFGDLYGAKVARRTDIIFVTDIEEIEEPEVTLDDVEDDDNYNEFEETTINPKEATELLSTDVFNKLFRDICNTFKFIEVDQLFTEKTIAEQVKYFHPFFSSYTPQDFNTRLTFLQQCLRNADQLGLDGNNPTNFAFGPMSVIYLSLGDFFKTKALIRNMSIDYNAYSLQWDLNPESGAGVQPMFAKVTLNLVILGGQSMSGAINRLQNALSFNFYSNTEMFDPRSDSLILNSPVDSEDESINEYTNIPKAKILNGVKGTEIVTPDRYEENKRLQQIRKEQQFLNAQDRFNYPPPTTTPSNLNDVNNLIELKKMLNLELTDEEKAFLESDASLGGTTT